MALRLSSANDGQTGGQVGSARVIAASERDPTAVDPQSGDRRKRRSSRKTRRAPQWLVSSAENLLILTFVLLILLGVFHHELWRDETQSWLIARDSTSLLDLFRNTHYEGHPLLWHYCLYGLSRISRNPLTMQFFSALLAIGSVVFVVKCSPFSLLQRGLIVFGYFTLYEYALLARSYGLGVFLIFLFCVLYGQRRPSFWGMTITLMLLANTSVLGLIMSLSLAIALYYRIALSPEQRQQQRHARRLDQLLGQRSMRPMRRPMIAGHLLALFVSWGLSALQIARSLLNPMGLAGFDAEARIAANSDAAQNIAQAASQSDQFDNIHKLLQIVLKGYLPLPTFSFHFWNGHLLADQALEPNRSLYILLLSAVLVVFVLLIAIRLLQKTPLFLTIYLAGSGGMMAFFVLVHRGSTRHYGYLFILLLACLWLSQGSQRYLSSTHLKSTQAKSAAVYWLLFTGILWVQAFAGFYAYSSDVLFPFSASYQTAQVIKTYQLADDLPILGINQRPVSPISAYLDRPIYYPEARQLGSFWDISYPELTEEEAIVEAVEAFAEENPNFIAILTQQLSAQTLAADSNTDSSTDSASHSTLSISYLAHIGPSIVADEAFYLYQVEQN
ncbi:MAG: hypothetical protein HLUCCA11_02690 [Phormidesmis priestleyi Ana]|uniref:Glycosyltransferase RgtA/B/C/D-like domain-containing protein n=1 Tax=Phormidesmis priestleyi Ana TaxID=1666911 RepID=A0A0P7Z353_9CYAN|nr:MAG: hypothetical protein HLUCCA11_02690 [Phormidesmis priestleyi Ana]